jgi:hypothetical protein
MQIGKRGQFLKFSYSDSHLTIEYIGLVINVGHSPAYQDWRRRSCKIICLARKVIEKDSNRWWGKDQYAPDKEWRIIPYKKRAELITYTDLPKYLNWELGSAFEKVLKGEKL